MRLPDLTCDVVWESCLILRWAICTTTFFPSNPLNSHAFYANPSNHSQNGTQTPISTPLPPSSTPNKCMHPMPPEPPQPSRLPNPHPKTNSLCARRANIPNPHWSQPLPTRRQNSHMGGTLYSLRSTTTRVWRGAGARETIPLVVEGEV